MADLDSDITCSCRLSIRGQPPFAVLRAPVLMLPVIMLLWSKLLSKNLMDTRINFIAFLFNIKVILSSATKVPEGRLVTWNQSTI